MEPQSLYISILFELLWIRSSGTYSITNTSNQATCNAIWVATLLLQLLQQCQYSLPFNT